MFCVSRDLSTSTNRASGAELLIPVTSRSHYLLTLLLFVLQSDNTLINVATVRVINTDFDDFWVRT